MHPTLPVVHSILSKFSILSILSIAIDCPRQQSIAIEVPRCPSPPSAASRPDFLNKNKIALKECSETLYWLTLVRRCNLLPDETAQTLWTQCDQLRRMIVSVCKTLESRK